MSDFFFFNDTATTEIYTLSLHDALPICWTSSNPELPLRASRAARFPLEELPDLLRGSRAVADRELDADGGDELDRKSTRLNSSHTVISYAVFCLKKKNNTTYLAVVVVRY